MITVLLCAIALVFLIPVFKVKQREKEIRETHATILKIEHDDFFLDRSIEDSEESGRHITIDTAIFHENLRSAYALRVMTSDANVTLIHEGKHIPTLKQVMEKLVNEPRPLT
ncbi:TPA: hypothetical protein JI078_18620 [Acinetobacter baumannii]|nr:hypothetical protein [Acinetobacter baumannii]